MNPGSYVLTLLLACQPVALDSDPGKLGGPPLLAGPGEDGFDADLAAMASGFDRQFLAINAAPFGMSLDVYIRPEHRGTVEAWLATGAGTTTADFEAHAVRRWDEIVYHTDEMGDLGMFGGVAAIAECYRYALLRDDPSASPDEVDAARVAYDRLLDGLHAMHTMPAVPGTIVRGVARRDQPGLDDVEIVPLFDADGAPLPADKHPVYRADRSGQYPDYVWIDDTSKDQLDGYILALGAAWEVGRADASVETRIAALDADATEIGRALMIPAPGTGLDLTVIDADGRPTTFGDLNAQQLEDVVLDEPRNPFNALLALATLRVLATVSGDPEILAFYEEVADERGYASLVGNVGTLVYVGARTNYSNVNMAFTALASLLRFEPEGPRRDEYLVSLQSMWALDTPRGPWEFEDAWFSVIQAVYADDTAAAGGMANLRGFGLAPAFEDRVENCDAAEIVAGSCLAVDGVTTIPLYGHVDAGVFVPGWLDGEAPTAGVHVPQRLRPPSNFEWRSDPYRVNGGGSDLLDPRGDWRAAYWAARYLGRQGG